MLKDFRVFHFMTLSAYEGKTRTNSEHSLMMRDKRTNAIQEHTRDSQEPLVFRVLRSSRVYFPSFLPLSEIWNKKSDQKKLKPNWAYELFTGTKT